MSYKIGSVVLTDKDIAYTTKECILMDESPFFYYLLPVRIGHGGHEIVKVDKDKIKIIKGEEDWIFVLEHARKLMKWALIQDVNEHLKEHVYTKALEVQKQLREILEKNEISFRVPDFFQRNPSLFDAFGCKKPDVIRLVIAILNEVKK